MPNARHGKPCYNTRLPPLLPDRQRNGSPAPFSRVESVDAELVRGTEFGFDSRTADAAPFAEPFGRDLDGEAEVITGDENLLSILWTVQWRVGDASEYRFGVGDPEELLRAFAESSLRRVCGRRTGDALLLADRAELQRSVQMSTRF